MPAPQRLPSFPGQRSTAPAPSNLVSEAPGDVDLLDRYRDGETSVFEELYRRHATRLYNLAYRMSGTAADAEDLLQEVFLQAFRKLPTFRGESALGTWLYRLALNLCLDHVRSRQARTGKLTDSLDDEDAAVPPVKAREPADLVVDRMDLERAIAELPPSYRAAFILHDVQGFEHHEVADLLAIAEGSSKSLVHKARLRLRTLLGRRRTE